MGGGRDDFRIFMVYCVKKTSLECPDRMNSSTLVGTICYYPKNGEFYFCGYDTFPVKHLTINRLTNHTEREEEIEINKRNRMMVFKIICKLCGITEKSNEYTKLLAQIEDINGIFIDMAIFTDVEKKQKIRYGPDEFGKLIDFGKDKELVIPYRSDKHVRYCIKLSSSFMSGMTLKWIKYIVEFVPNPKNTVDISITDSKRKTEEIKICTLEKTPTALALDILESAPVPVVDNKPTITLFDDGENAVLINALTEEELKNAKLYAFKADMRGYSGEVFSHFGMIGTFVSDDDVLNKAATLYRSIPEASEEYKKCSTSPNPIAK